MDNEMLDRVRASIEQYPNAGGDVGVMKAIDTLVEKAKEEGRAEAIRKYAFGPVLLRSRPCCVVPLDRNQILTLLKELYSRAPSTCMATNEYDRLSSAVDIFEIQPEEWITVGNQDQVPTP